MRLAISKTHDTPINNSSVAEIIFWFKMSLTPELFRTTKTYLRIPQDSSEKSVQRNDFVHKMKQHQVKKVLAYPPSRLSTMKQFLALSLALLVVPNVDATSIKMDL